MSGRRFNHDLDKTGAIPVAKLLANLGRAPAEPLGSRRQPMDPRVSGALALLAAVVIVVSVTLWAVLP